MVGEEEVSKFKYFLIHTEDNVILTDTNADDIEEAKKDIFDEMEANNWEESECLCIAKVEVEWIPPTPVKGKWKKL